MNLRDLGNLVKQKYTQYVSDPAEDLGRRVVEKYPEYKQKITAPLQEWSNKKYNERAMYGVEASVNKDLANFGLLNGVDWRGVQQLLNRKNLPGQVLTGAIADNQDESQVFKIQEKMNKGEIITEDEKKTLADQSLMMVAGVTTPIKSTGKNPVIIDPDKYKKLYNDYNPLNHEKYSQMAKKEYELYNQAKGTGTDLLSEAKKYGSAEEFKLFAPEKNVYKHIEEKTGITLKKTESNGRFKIIKDGKDIGVFTGGELRSPNALQNDPGEIVINMLGIEPKGTGIGTQIVNSLKELADLKQKPLVATNATNLGSSFWKKMGFDVSTKPGKSGITGNAVYKPKKIDLTDIYNQAKGVQILRVEN